MDKLNVVFTGIGTSLFDAAYPLHAEALLQRSKFLILQQACKDEDEEFSLEIVINAPGSVGMQDAIDHKKLGNSALEAYPEAIFLSSYCNIQRLIREDPVFGKAYREKRFRFMVTESVLPYALFQMEYKPGFEAYSHMKVDLYSEGLVSNMDRRCMMIFKETDPENYSFFVERYKCVRNVRESRRLIAENHERWLQEWADMQEEMSE